MAIEDTGIALTIAWWQTQWDKIEVLTGDGMTTEDNVPVVEAKVGYLESTVFFAYNEANFHIEKVKTYAGATLIAENAIDITKTSRQSLTIIRKDYLEGV